MKKELQMIGGIWCATVRSSDGKVMDARDFESRRDAEEWLRGYTVRA